MDDLLYVKHGGRYSPAKPGDIIAAAIQVLRELNQHKIADSIVRSLVENQTPNSSMV